VNGVGRLDFCAAPKPLYSGVGTQVWIRLPDERRIVTRIAFTVEDLTASTEGIALDPALDLAPNEAQSLMDALWYAGVRPSNGEGSTGKLAATEYHLEDMRRLVFTAPTTTKEDAL